MLAAARGWTSLDATGASLPSITRGYCKGRGASNFAAPSGIRLATTCEPIQLERRIQTRCAFMTSGAAPKEYGERAETWAARRRTIGRRCILRTGDLKSGVAHGHHDAQAQRARTARMRRQRRRRGRDGNCHDQRVEEGRVAA